jgi:WD40 repeat protein/serine/threonine protein kinase
MASSVHESSSPEERVDALIADWLEAIERGQAPDPQDLISRHPDMAPELTAFFADRLRFQQAAGRMGESQLPEGLERRFGVHELLDEIARGGMGVVLKGRDTAIGREVAVKVLQERHIGEAELLQRFVEEAQIAGQLQHPGIAPIYELGEFADRRPYFTMKLIKGETLAKLLASRPGPEHDRPRLLKIFEQVCQTLAYAHSRGVIHRDLKPANIMVGAFGEVQVMDWGLAKVLSAQMPAAQSAAAVAAPGTSVIRTRRSDDQKQSGGSSSQTQVGSILGTLAYMPPEQALGETERIDRRGDVFGLGAILCEILTGKPPYTGESFEQLRQQAIRAELGDAFDRLERCGADRDLIELARRALAAEPAARPADAEVLARALNDHFDGVESRLRQAELAEVQARTRAVEERRRRRMTLVSAGAVLVVLAVGVIGTTWGLLAERAARETLRRELFVADLELAGQEWDSEEGTATHVASLLEAHVPRNGEADLREFSWRLQWTALHRNATVLKGHSGGARLAAFAPDGQLVTVDGDLALRRWNPAMEPLPPLISLSPKSALVPSHISAWALSADARYLALGASDTVHLFDARTGEETRHVTGEALVIGVEFAETGDKLAVLWRDGEAETREVASGNVIARFHLQEDDDLAAVQGVGLAVDGRSLFVLGYPSGSEIARLTGTNETPGKQAHRSTVNSMAVTRDGRFGATGDANGLVCLWNGVTDEKLGEMKVHHGIVEALAFSPDGSQLATGGDDGVVTVCEVARFPGQRAAVFKGHAGRVHALAFDADGRRLASASNDGTTRVWNLEHTGQSRIFGTHDLPVFSVAFSADGRRLAVGTGSGSKPPGGIVRVWQYPAETLEAEFPGAEGRVLGLAFTTRDGSILATGGYDSRLRLWDVPGKSEFGQARPGHVADPPDPYRHGIGSLAVSPDGHLIAAGFGVPTYHHPDFEQTARVWNLMTGTIHDLPGHFNNIPSLAFSRDGTRLATAGDDQQLKLWSVSGWKNIQTLRGAERFKAVAFSADGRWLATGGDSGTIRLWETASGDPIRELRGHSNAVQHLEFSPDGRTLASASWDSTVKLWDPVSGRETRTLRDHDDWISCLAFSPDGQTLVTGSFDATVRPWEAAPLSEITAELAADEAAAERRRSRLRAQEAERHVRPALHLSQPRLDEFTGSYERGRTVRRDGDHLTIFPVRGALGDPVAILPQSEKEFFSRDQDLDVTFLRDPEGRVTRLIIHQNGRSFEAKKVVESGG